MKRLLILLFALTLSAASNAELIGETLPNFEFRETNGKQIELNDLKASSPTGVVMLTFWCTSCGSCRKTENYLRDLTERYRDHATIVAVASSRKDDKKDIKKYLAKKRLNLKVILDPASQLGHHLGVKKTTTSVIIDEQGKIRYLGTLKKKKKLYAENSLQAVLTKRMVPEPIGPNHG